MNKKEFILKLKNKLEEKIDTKTSWGKIQLKEELSNTFIELLCEENEN